MELQDALHCDHGKAAARMEGEGCPKKEVNVTQASCLPGLLSEKSCNSKSEGISGACM